MSDVRAYATGIGVLPTTVIQKAGAGGGSTWSRWEDGGGCSMRTVEKVCAYMAEHPAPEKQVDAA